MPIRHHPVQDFKQKWQSEDLTCAELNSVNRIVNPRHREGGGDLLWRLFSSVVTSLFSSFALKKASASLNSLFPYRIHTERKESRGQRRTLGKTVGISVAPEFRIRMRWEGKMGSDCMCARFLCEFFFWLQESRSRSRQKLNSVRGITFLCCSLLFTQLSSLGAGYSLSYTILPSAGRQQIFLRFFLFFFQSHTKESLRAKNESTEEK